jgi:hypothetical protein
MSLLFHGIIYGRKKFYSTGPWKSKLLVQFLLLFSWLIFGGKKISIWWLSIPVKREPRFRVILKGPHSATQWRGFTKRYRGVLI